MKNKNILLMLESQIDKIVLVIYILISLALLWVYVIGNPYGQKVRVDGREKKLSPSNIDQRVKQQAEMMLPELQRSATEIPVGKAYLPEYEQLLQCSISGISSSVHIPSPGAGNVSIEEDRLYALPEIPALSEVTVANLRGAARIPTEEITPDLTYDTVPAEVEDIDFVSVSARFDVQRLNTNFQQSFMGARLKTTWKDPSLAKPLFARLELQRRSKQNDNSWGPWVSVPRTKIDAYQQQLEELPSTLEQSQFGMNLLMPLYQGTDIQHDILQPDYYSFTVSRVEWMPPTFLNEAIDILKKEEEKTAREKRDELLRARTPDTNRGNRRAQPPTRPQPGGRDPGIVGAGGELLAPRTTLVRKDKGIDDVKKEFEKELLNENSDISDKQGPLLVWAHDDTVQPGKTYQYRIRMGVFNPIAGKDWFEKDQVQYKDQVVLWSQYSEPTEELFIPRRSYVFPMGVIANDNAAADIEGVQVEVTKYYLGQWWDFEFDVYQGEIIGYEVEDVQEKDKIQNPLGGNEILIPEMGLNQVPETIDFTTDITFVDVAKETYWGSRLRPSLLYQMLYYDADGLKQMPIGKGNWDSDTRQMYTEIQESMSRDVEQRGLGASPEMMPRVRNPELQGIFIPPTQ